MQTTNDRPGALPGGMRALVAATGLAAVALALGFTSRNAIGCPTNDILCLNDWILPHEPQRSHSCTGPGVQGSASYDLTAGTFHVSSSSAVFAADVTMILRDDYRVVSAPGGVPLGTPIDVTVELEVHGTINPRQCWSYNVLGVALGDSWTPAARFVHTPYSCDTLCSCSGVPTVDTLLTWTRSEVVGRSFGLTYRMSVSAVEASAEIGARVRFSGLPEGTTVVSCQGYRQDAPVPVHRPTWGTVKLRYR